MIRLAAVLVYGALLLFLDSRAHSPWPGEYVLGLLTFAMLWLCSRNLPKNDRKTVWLCVIVATGFEILGSLVWKGYRYRFGGIPLFVPFGHGLIYIFGLGLAATNIVRKYERHFSLLILAVALVWTVAGLTMLPSRTGRVDVHGLIWLPLFAYVLLFSRQKAFFAAIFIATTDIELFGTWFHSWTWAAHTPWFHVTSGNPPSAIAGGYAIIDGSVAQLAKVQSALAAAIRERYDYFTVSTARRTCMKRAFSLLFAVVLSACSGAGMGSQSSLSAVPDSTARNQQSIAVTSTVWDVQTGASSNSFSFQALDFYPSTITINAGDSIRYRVASLDGGDGHTVSFVPPGQPVPPPFDPNNLVPSGGTTVDGTHFVNSGLLLGGQVFTLRFPRTGSYTIYCLFHEPAMIMHVTVNPAGTPYPHNAQFYLTTGRADQWEDLTAAQNSLASFPFANGGTTFAAGIDPGLVHLPPPDSTVLRFINSNDRSKAATAGSITVRVGTVLTWVNLTSNEPHTVTFALAGADDLPNMPPDPAVNVAPPGHITTYDGTKIVNSGTFVGLAPPPHNQFQIKMTRPGRYLYGCLYHDNSRMVGWVTVTP